MDQPNALSIPQSSALSPCPATDPLLRSSLAAAGLPTDDLENGRSRYFVLYQEGKPLAFGGIEGLGDDRLLRSVVVAGERGHGAGSRTVELLAAKARDNGAVRLWLLTTDATDFFAPLGWRCADRGSAPEAIRCTGQFASLCPASAALMVRDLAQ